MGRDAFATLMTEVDAFNKAHAGELPATSDQLSANNRSIAGSHRGVSDQLPPLQAKPTVLTIPPGLTVPLALLALTSPVRFPAAPELLAVPTAAAADPP